MDSFLTRFKNPLVLIAIVLAQVLALAVQVQRPTTAGIGESGADGRKVTALRYWMVALVTPAERLSHGTSLRVRNLWSNYVDLRHTRQQNDQLQKEVARLRLEQEEFAEDAAQGRRLQALLAFKQKYIATTVAAQVIGTSGSDRSGLVYIDKGSADGLKPEQPVMTPDGIVGKLRDVFPHTAQLLLLSDPTSGAGVILTSSRMRGIVRGTANGQVQIDNLTRDSRIKVGEEVVTSGGDMVFPRGLPVGVIESIVDDPHHQPYTAITIKTAANLSRLEEVLVITGTQATLPEVAQQDAAQADSAAQADAAAEANKRAADLIAEKLPTIHDETTVTPGANGQPATVTPNSAVVPNLVGGVPGIPNSGLPKPQPTLHPDRYTPGATPPATSLTPGGSATPESPDAGQEKPKL